MKPIVLIISKNNADCEAISQAAVSQGCRMFAAGSVDEAPACLGKLVPSLLYVDAEFAKGGGTLRSLAGAWGGSDIPVILIIKPDIKHAHLKSLKPWVHDYLTTPVVREVAAAQLRNLFRIKDLEQATDKAVSNLEQWLSRCESVVHYFDPFSFDRDKAQDDLAQRLVRRKQTDVDRPACLMVAVPDGKNSLRCDIHTSNGTGPAKLSSRITIPEAMVFHRIKAENGAAAFNHFDRGGRLADFQSHFPPEILQVTDTIYNVVGLEHSGMYVLAFNYGRPVTSDDALFLKGLSLPGSFLGIVAGNVQDISESFLIMAQALAIATDSQGDRGAHVRRMNEYARVIAESMSLPGRFVQTIAYSAQLHDVGKIYIHPDLLDKPLRLTSQEFDLVKKHPMLGAQILGDSPLLSIARNIALTHHECWDGSGYPRGLSGESIPLEGAIVKVADVYDALRTMHSYKSSYSHGDARRIILAGGGDDLHEIRTSQFHPDVLKAFEQAEAQFDDIYQSVGA